MRRKKLTLKQAKFVGKYIKDGNVHIPVKVSSDSGVKFPLIPELTFHPRSEATL